MSGRRVNAITKQTTIKWIDNIDEALKCHRIKDLQLECQQWAQRTQPTQSGHSSVRCPNQLDVQSIIEGRDYAFNL